MILYSYLYIPQLSACTVRARNGTSKEIQNAFIRGSQITLIVLPSELSNSRYLEDMVTADRRRGEGGNSRTHLAVFFICSEVHTSTTLNSKLLGSPSYIVWVELTWDLYILHSYGHSLAPNLHHSKDRVPRR